MTVGYKIMILLFPLLCLAQEVWLIPVMTCTPCEEKIQVIVNELNISSQVEAISSISKTLCFKKEISQDTAVRLEEELKRIKFIVTEKKVVDGCPQEVIHPWSDVKGDFETISKGERVSIKKHLVKGKYTIIDFGAVWCGPCHEVASRIKPMLEQREDIAVRAIELPDNQQTAFDAPVVFQHLSQAEGLPYMILFDKRGKKQYEGNDVDELLRYIEQ